MIEKRMELNKMSNQLVIAGITAMVEDDGLTPHEAFEVLEDIKRNIWSALAEIRQEVRNKCTNTSY